MQIRITEEVLTDKSKVHDVLLCDDEEGVAIRIPCMTEKHAIQLADSIEEAVKIATGQ